MAPADVDRPLRERAVLAAMAEGRSSLGIARSLFTGLASVENHVTAIFRTLPLEPAGLRPRRVQAVLTCLRAGDGRR